MTSQEYYLTQYPDKADLINQFFELDQPADFEEFTGIERSFEEMLADQLMGESF